VMAFAVVLMVGPSAASDTRMLPEQLSTKLSIASVSRPDQGVSVARA
jgi:hypothetical protein